MTKKQDNAFLGAIVFAGIATALEYETHIIIICAFLGYVIGGIKNNKLFYD